MGNVKASIVKGKQTVPAVHASTYERGAVYAEPELIQISLEHTALNKCKLNYTIYYHY